MAAPVEPADTPSAWAQRWSVLVKCLLLLAAALVVVLIVSGAVLAGTYRPTSTEAWPGLEGIAVGAPDQYVRTVHRTASTMLLPVVVGAGVGVIAWAVTTRRRAWLGGVALTLSTVAAGITGFMLAWDQIALWAVTVGTNVDGVWWVATDSAVRFVIVDGTEVSQSTYRNAVGAHLLLTVAVVASIVAIAWNLRVRHQGVDLDAG